MSRRRDKHLWYLYGGAIITLLLILFTVMYLKSSEGNYSEQADNTILKLNGPWKFKTGDDPQWTLSSTSDSLWETVDFTAPPGAHDGDVGISGYIPGWASHGHPTYSGYAWYRMHISTDSIVGDQIALLAPPAVDDAYQLFINGNLLGSAGDFSNTPPVAYGIQPRIFLLPDHLRKERSITIAFRVWMSPETLGQVPDAGGIHVAPELGEQRSVKEKYKFQWAQSIKGYIVEVVEPIMFILLALTLFLNRAKNNTPSSKWFIIGLLLVALLRANQAVYSWFQIESTHQYDIVTTVIIRSLVFCSWPLAWWNWYNLRKPGWIPKMIAVLTIIYMTAQLLGLEWVSTTVNHLLFQQIAQYVRYLFLAFLLYIICRGFMNEKRKDWLALLAALLIAAGLFPQEVSLLHIPGIWFPYGVGVSRSQYIYAAFVLIMYLVLIQRQRKTSL